jgi:pteridine reductase
MDGVEAKPSPDAARPCDWTAQCVLVTGAARRLGAALARALAERGAAVALHYHRSGEEARRLAEEIAPRARATWLFPADLSDPDQQERLAREVLLRCGRVTGLVNSASLYRPTPFDALGRDDWDAHLAVNLAAPVWLSVRLGRAMRESGGGAIVQVGDWSTSRPYPAYLPYTASKGALEAATRALARELAPHVRVNMVALGPILLPEGTGPDYEERVRRAVPLGRVGEPAEFTRAVLFLLGDATFTTGSVLTVDGGRGLA